MANRKTPAQILAIHKGPKSKFARSTVSRAARELGYLGGIAGGPARAEVLSDDDRYQIAVHAANMRWGNPCSCKRCGGGMRFS